MIFETQTSNQQPVNMFYILKTIAIVVLATIGCVETGRVGSRPRVSGSGEPPTATTLAVVQCNN